MELIQEPSSLLLTISNYCSSRCSHCPMPNSVFSLTPIEIKKIILNNKRPIIIISGGEPFENEHLLNYLHLIEKKKNSIYRIATGGHINLSQFLEYFNSSQFLSGISLGTDQFFSVRQPNSQKLQVWLSNLDFFEQNDIPYSVTLTLGRDLEKKSLSSLFSLLKKYAPQFILLQNSDTHPMNQQHVQQVLHEIDQSLPTIKVKNECAY